MRDAPSTAPPVRSIRLVDVADRFFPLFWIGLYLLLPTSGWADIMFTGWLDQKRDLGALRSVIETGEAEAIEGNHIGPAYIALAVWIHEITGLSPETSLIALNRTAYATTVAAGLVGVRLLVRRLVSAPASVSLVAQFMFLALVLASVTWFWSDVPWSHFVAMCLGLLVYATRVALRPSSVAAAGVIGVLLALLVLTRSFEAVSLLLAWVLVVAVFASLRLGSWRVPRLTSLATGLGTFLVTAVAVHVTTGREEPFFLYGGTLGRQAGDLPAVEVAETPTFSLHFLPVKLVQLFVEPCFYSMCQLSDYAGTAEPLTGPLVDSSGQERLWRLPLAIQLPSLALLPLCIAGVGVLVIWLGSRRRRASQHRRDVRLVTEMTVAATGIVVGYSGSTLTGSSHLRYGFARDFLLPAALAGVVAVVLAACGLWLVLGRRERVGLWPTRAHISRDAAMAATALIASVLMGVAVWAGHTYGVPRIVSRLGPVAYTADCAGHQCDVTIRALSVGGEPTSIPERSTLTFGCGSDVPRFTIYSRRPTKGVTLDERCADPRLVAAWPTVMGLPPGRPEHRVVEVVNER